MIMINLSTMKRGKKYLKNVKFPRQRKCKECGEEFTQYNPLQTKCNECVLKQMYKKKPKCKPLPKPKKPIPKVKKNKSEVEKLRDKAWKLWSAYIREKEKYICFTCGRQKDKKTTEAGHFKHGKLDFDPMNIHCQCTYCNKYLHGNLGVYATKLIDKYGRKAFDDLVLRANKHTNKYSINELEEIIDKIKYENTKSLPF